MNRVWVRKEYVPVEEDIQHRPVYRQLQAQPDRWWDKGDDDSCSGLRFEEAKELGQSINMRRFLK